MIITLGVNDYISLPVLFHTIVLLFNCWKAVTSRSTKIWLRGTIFRR